MWTIKQFLTNADATGFLVVGHQAWHRFHNSQLHNLVTGPNWYSKFFGKLPNGQTSIWAHQSVDFDNVYVHRLTLKDVQDAHRRRFCNNLNRCHETNQGNRPPKRQRGRARIHTTWFFAINEIFHERLSYIILKKQVYPRIVDSALKNVCLRYSEITRALVFVSDLFIWTSNFPSSSNVVIRGCNSHKSNGYSWMFLLYYVLCCGTNAKTVLSSWWDIRLNS